jgi:malonate transporter
MVSVLSALWPVFALLILGFIARRTAFPGDAFWEPAERLTYFVLFPVLLVNKLGAADMSDVAVVDIAAAVGVLFLSGTLFCFIARYWMGLSLAGFTSFYQGSVRFNTYVALATAAAIYGDAAVAISAVIIAFMIPLVNFLCVMIFSMFISNANAPTLSSLLKNLIKNPLIISCFIGISLNISGIGLHKELVSVAGLLGAMALPLGLLAVGAGLNMHALRTAQLAVWCSSLIKLLLLPLVMYCFCLFMGFSSLITGLLLIFSSVPTAPSGYILARQLGGDASMMAAIITGQTLLSMLTLPFILSTLM